MRTPCLPLVLALAWIPLPGQAGVRLTQVPAEVRLPVAEGRQLLLEVEVTGAARDVWLATGPEQLRRVPLSAAGGGIWQINLADPSVFGIVRSTGERNGRLFVCAEIDGKVTSSEPIAWTRPLAAAVPPRCLLHVSGRTRPDVAFCGQDPWVEPHLLDRIEVTGVARPSLGFVARMGSTTVPLVPDEDRSAWTLPLDDGRRAAWLTAGLLEVEEHDGAAVAVLFELKAVPDLLDLPEGKAAVTVKQRGQVPVPGSRGGIVVAIDDITGGQVAITVQTANGRVLAGPRSRREREELPFTVGTTHYLVQVAKLTNLLIGDDFADLEIAPVAAAAGDPIARLLERIEAAPIRFLREGKEYDGKEAAAHLRTKLATADTALTVEQFIDRIASRSSTTGNEYRIRLPDGTEQPAAAWLRQQATADGGAAGRR